MSHHRIRPLRRTEGRAAAASALLAASLVSWGALVPLRPPQTTVAQAILLSPAVAEAPPATAARGIFLATTVSATLPSTVVLASSPDGTGALCTDDQATITFSRAGQRQVWAHLFARADRQGITCLPPQAVQLPVGAGEYAIAITLEDRFAPTYHSRPYYLVFTGETVADEHAPPTRVAAAVAPTRVATTAFQTAAPSPTAFASVIPTTAPLTTTTQRPDDEGKGRAASPPPQRYATASYLLAAVVALVALAAFVLLRQRRPQTQRMGGIVDLFDRETGEGCTLLLHRFPTGAGIARYPLQAITWQSGDTTQRLVAAIVPGATQPLLREGGNDVGVALTAGERLLVAGAVEVEYRQA